MITVEEVPPPNLPPGHILIRNRYSLISAGTERARVEVGRQGLIGKARQRPDQVKQVVRSVRECGLRDTYRLVSDRLETPFQVGYSSAGVALKVGTGVEGISPGMRLAAGGAGYASHAEIVCVPKNLCVAVPDGVPFRSATFATVGAIALHGIHLAEIQPGSRVAVIGLGLVGQLAVRLLTVYGCDVIGVDRDPVMLSLARAVGIPVLARNDEYLVDAARAAWSGAGADAVLITAATRNADPVELAGELARDRAVVVIVGDVTVAPPRPAYYGKELSIRYSRSYGPGRYDRRYELDGVDYPSGYVPWTERRNMAEVVRLLSHKLLDVESLQPVEFDVDKAPAAYDLLGASGSERRVAIVLSYGENPDVTPSCIAPIDLPTRPARRPDDGVVRIAAVGAGAFPTRMLFPHLARNSTSRFSWITTSGGVSARHQGARWGFTRAVSNLNEGLALDDADCVMVLSRHDSHAQYAATVLGAGLTLYCEKPLALNEAELDDVAKAWTAGNAPAMVGFNRRFAPSVRDLKSQLTSRLPIQVSYRVFAGKLPSDHWYFEDRQGGRTLGEVCHFLDLATYLVGSVPVRVYAQAVGRPSDVRHAQSVSILVEYAEGSSATIHYGGLTPSGAPKELVEIAADGLAARIDDFRSLTVWSGSRGPGITRYRPGAAKGHAEEMNALLDLCVGREPPEATSFVLSLWSSLLAWRAVESAAAEQVLTVEPQAPALRAAIGLSPSAYHDQDAPRES
jgi:predicted dehydrogenase/threonine dehydrogenase-like Zn-dependent dehydrogenase